MRPLPGRWKRFDRDQVSVMVGRRVRRSYLDSSSGFADWHGQDARAIIYGTGEAVPFTSYPTKPP
jgi:hypothetical protein